MQVAIFEDHDIKFSRFRCSQRNLGHSIEEESVLELIHFLPRCWVFILPMARDGIVYQADPTVLPLCRHYTTMQPC